MCEKETDFYVWIAGKKDAKMTQYGGYFNTPEEAIKYLTDRAKQEVDRCKYLLDHAETEQAELLKDIRKLKF